MTYKEACDWVGDISIKLINSLPEISNLLEAKLKTNVIYSICDRTNLIIKDLKPMNDFSYDFFKSDDVYDSDKVKKTYINMIQHIVADFSNDYEINCGKIMSGILQVEMRNDKLDKI